MRILSLIALAPFALLACDGNNDSTTLPTDTKSDATTEVTNPTDTGTGTTTATETTPTETVTTPGTVKALQGEAEIATCDPTKIATVNPSVTLTGVVVTSPKYDAFTPTAPGKVALDGYYVADADGGAWSGIAIVVDRAQATAFVPGDVLDVQGQLEEYYCFTQVKATTVTAKSPTSAPAPIQVQGANIKEEAYEGMLVTVKGVTVTEALQGGVFKVDPGAFLVGHAGFDFFLAMDVGATYDVTGQVSFGFGEYRLIPRTAADLVKTSVGTTTPTTIKALEQTAASTGCSANSIQNISANLEVTGTIATAKFTAASTLDGYYLTDETSDPYAGTYLVIPTALATNFAVGDKVKVVGQHVEYYCMTELKAEVVTKLEGTGTVPAAVVLTKSTPAADLEQYEGMLVEVAGLTATKKTEHNETETDGTMLIDGQVMGAAFQAPATGTFAKVTGILHYGFSKYRIAPRSASDLVAQ